MMTAEENEPLPLRIIGVPKRKNGKYVLDEFAILNRECGWICPRCNEEVRICPTKAGEQTFMCRKCNASFTVRVDAEATTFMLDKKKPTAPPASSQESAVGIIASPIVSQQQAQKPARGMLLTPEDDDTPKKPVVETPAIEEDDIETKMVQKPDSAPNAKQQETNGSLQWGGFFSRKHYKLRPGENIIGRKDKKTPSDVEFDDPEMSRRSVKIDAIPDRNGDFSFTLTVMKALNVVMVNDRQLGLADSVKLKNNDTILMGKTTLVFKCP